MSRISVVLKGPGTDPKYCCSSCGNLLDQPRQTACGHRYCKVCVEELTKNGASKCMGHRCGETITIEEAFPDRAIEREIRTIAVLCNNENDGCKWEGFFRDLKDHLLECDFAKVPCVHEGHGCQARILRRNLGEHLVSECEFRMEVCQWCKGNFSHKDMKEHQRSCLLAPAKCEWCGQKNLTLGELQKHQHVETGNCPNMKRPCPFAPSGCKERLETKHISDHERKSVTGHLTMVQQLLLEQASSFEQHSRQEVDFREKMRALLPRLEKKGEDLDRKIAQLEQQLSSNGSEGATASSSSSIKALENRVEQQRSKVEDVIKKLAGFEPRVGTFEGIVAVLNREIEKCSSQMEAYERQRRQDREIIETLERKVRSLERIIALKDVALAEQDLRIQTLELTSYDGILTWKIADFTRKRHDAITGKTASFYSPCFFTSRTGYKMCARVYLNGDGMGKGTHVSMFFVVMRGHFDGLLRWPFRQKVTFMLLDQNNREHVIDAFRPDPTSSSFQRPTSDMNIASGCPLFVPLSQLESSSHAYVKDDTMFLRVIVDTSDLN